MSPCSPLAEAYVYRAFLTSLPGSLCSTHPTLCRVGEPNWAQRHAQIRRILRCALSHISRFIKRRELICGAHSQQLLLPPNRRRRRAYRRRRPNPCAQPTYRLKSRLRARAFLSLRFPAASRRQTPWKRTRRYWARTRTRTGDRANPRAGRPVRRSRSGSWICRRV